MLNSSLSKFIPGQSFMLIRLCYAFMIALLPYSLNGQERTEDTIRSLTMEETVMLALDNNINIKNAKLESQNAAYDGVAFKLKPFQAEYHRGQIHSPLIDQTLEVYQNLGSPLQSYYTKKQSDYSKEVKEEELEIIKAETEKEVKRTYFKWVYLYNKKQILQERLDVYKELERISEVRQTMGNSGELAEISAQSMFHKAKRDLKKLRNQISIIENELKIQLNTRHHILPATDTLLLYEINQTKSNQKDIVNNRYQKLYEDKIRASEYEIKVQKAKYLPELSAGYFWQEIENKGGFDGWMLGISIPVSFKSQKADVEKAKVNKVIAENNLNYQKQKQETTVKNLVQRLNSYKEDIIFYHESGLKESENILSYAQEQLINEEIEIQEYVDLHNRAYIIKQDYLKAVKNYNQTAVQLEFYLK
ncbi:MAG: TolC family protein [Bacteroidales bacterium]